MPVPQLINKDELIYLLLKLPESYFLMSNIMEFQEDGSIKMPDGSIYPLGSYVLSKEQSGDGGDNAKHLAEARETRERSLLTARSNADQT